ncbi:hypothetical protein PIB30_022487 [Stylosanthes scabra]|uniref:Uncharacterized protein n=1 Tax=Stylosanthes scabra TaxID=79078 RepID=A0ABU6UB20_9FABA|nr:hypothetical protein [Stylosanthes scabra]
MQDNNRTSGGHRQKIENYNGALQVVIESKIGFEQGHYRFCHLRRVQRTPAMVPSHSLPLSAANRPAVVEELRQNPHVLPPTDSLSLFSQAQRQELPSTAVLPLTATAESWWGSAGSGGASPNIPLSLRSRSRQQWQQPPSVMAPSSEVTTETMEKGDGDCV